MGAGLTRTGRSMMEKCAGGGLALLLAAMFAVPSLAQTQRGGPSDLTVTRLMGYAWAITPPTFTPPNAKTIVIDKSKPELVKISREAAVEIIIGGYRTYEADLCGLTEDAMSNSSTLRLRIQKKYNLTEQQNVYANQLHVVTVQYSKGGLKISGDDDNKAVELLNIPLRDPKECSDDRRKRVGAAVAKYVEQDADAATPQPTKASTAK